MFSFFYRKKEENTIKSIWEKISKSILNKNDLSTLNENFYLLYKIIKEESNKINSEQLNYLKENNILNEIANLALFNIELRPILLEYLSYFLGCLKYRNDLFAENDDLIISLQSLVINLRKDLEQKSYKFNLKNEFANLLNSITRIILNNASILSFFIIKSQKLYINEEYDDFIIFSCLLKLLQLDQMITNYDLKKNIRRSLIIFLSFDEINKSDYLLNDSFIIEILVDKLCTYYQMLPSYFDINENSNTLEPIINININQNCFKSIYFDYKDYIIFLDKIINCFTDIRIKIKFQNYFFIKFLLENILPNLLSPSLKKFRSHLQYLATLLNISKNNSIIINTLSYFLLGLSDDSFKIENNNQNDSNIIENNSLHNNTNSVNNDQSNNNSNIYYSQINENQNENDDDSLYMSSVIIEYDPGKIRKKILKNMHKKSEYINIIIYQLFNIFFEKKPFLSMKNFIRPYTDFVINKSNNKSKFIFANNTIYPVNKQLINLMEKYEGENKCNNNKEKNIECLLFKNLCYYINNNINFYEYYQNNKKKENLLLDESNRFIDNNINKEDASFRINEDSFSEQQSNQEILEDNIIKGLNPNYIKNLLDPNESNEKKLENIKIKNKAEDELIIKDIFENDIYIKEESEEAQIDIDYNINFEYKNEIGNEVDSIDKNEDLLFMKNLHHKLINYENNTNIENILLFNLMITIISIPNFSFDNDLLKCNLVLLDNDDKSKYSFLNIFKTNSQKLLNQLQISENEQSFQKILKEFELNESNNENKKYKIGLDFQGFKRSENMSIKEKEKNKIINWVIFCEFIKEFLSCISQKYKFEEVIERLFSFYSEQLDEYYNENGNDDEEENENKDDEGEKFF